MLTIAGAIAVILNEQLGLEIPKEIQGPLLVVLVVAYVVVEGIKDIISPIIEKKLQIKKK